ncbi:centriole and centriolar satellite protein ofd1 isoform X2 [Xyrauchen texanus]|uniref:centriole and centriolar satellite protein ofd1 isoform X2 n=1 Tax=Xyrauchen texanus TaxID=154827 RepID=UPI0022426BD4|nr:centriole and centriolar satellite protein ofd1 isoform X2 [Xyrauchen texanus]
MKMSVRKEESLSPDEMRQKLYQTFKSRGVLDTLKTQLRNQLIQELQQPARRGETVLRPAAAHTDSVLVSACNSVVIDHLRSVGYDYTLSVFYPESGMNKDKVLSTRDLLQLIKISPHLPLYKALISNIQKGEKGFLLSLLTELTDHHVSRERCDTSTQTTSTPAHKESLVEKMQLIDEEYEGIRHRGDRWASVEAKLAEYRKEIHEQAQVELNAKLQHFMDAEITKVKREEQEKSRKEILELRRDMERTYEHKSEALMSRERNAIERLQKQQEIVEKEIYAQRQALLNDIETVRSREAELKQRVEDFDKTRKLHEEKVTSMDDVLRRRELSVKSMEDSFNQKLKSELMKYQLELREDNVKRTEQLTENENKNKAETLRLQKQSAVIDAKAEEHERHLTERKLLEVELESVRSQASLLAQQNNLLRERLENMSDYPALKRETLELHKNITLMRQQIEENQLENQRLRQDLSAPSKEQLALQTELRRLETARRLDKEEFETQKQVLHKQLQYEVQQCALLKAQLLECEERTRWMTSQTEEVKLQLRQTQQALENEILRNPKPSLVDRSLLTLSSDKLLPPDVYIDSAVLMKARPSDGNLCEAGVALSVPRQPWSRGEAPEQDSELVSGALARIRELEKEAERLEEAYRSHQRRAVQDLSHPRRTTPYIRPTAATAHRVTFVAAGRDQTVERFGRSPSPRDQTPPPRRLSSTPVSTSKSKRRTDADESVPSFTQDGLRMTSDTDGPSVPFADLSTQRQISPITAGDSIADISPLYSPRMKSTTRDHSSPPKLQEVISSSSQESSPQPEKITLHDLTDPGTLVSADQECILQKLEDSHTERCQEEKDVVLSDVQPSSASAVTLQKDMREEEEEERWQEERRTREERRQREREEAQEREQRELQRLQQELEAQYEEQAKEERGTTEGHVTPTASPIGGTDEDKAEEVSGGADVTNPLQKYMMMVMQEKQEQSPNKAASQEQSAHDILLSDKDDSFGALSREDPDDDFW